MDRTDFVILQAKSLNNELHANSRLFDNLRSAAAALVRSLEGELDPRELEAIERPPEELAQRYGISILFIYLFLR